MVAGVETSVNVSMKAIIPAAGFGTRFLPATKVVPKEMLPLGDRPALHLIVAEAVAAGASEVIIVTSPDKSVIRDYFTPAPEWQQRLAGKPEIREKMAELDQLCARVRFVEQREQRGLGHAILQAAPLLTGQSAPFLVLLGDAVASQPESCSPMLSAISKEHGSCSVIGLQRVAPERVSSYGIVAGRAVEGERDVFVVDGVVEKPALAEAPSNLAIAGRYLLSPAILPLLERQVPAANGEIQLTDSISELIRSERVMGYCYSGERFDIGNPLDYRSAVGRF